MDKTIKEIMEEHKGKEFHLYDLQGIWGELPLSEFNMEHVPDVWTENDGVIRFYIE